MDDLINKLPKTLIRHVLLALEEERFEQYHLEKKLIYVKKATEQLERLRKRLEE